LKIFSLFKGAGKSIEWNKGDEIILSSK